MKFTCNLLLLLLPLLLGDAATAAAAESDAATPATSTISIDVKNGVVTLQARDTPLPEVLSELGKLTGFKTILVAAAADFPRVSARFENLPVREIVERLVQDTNRIIFFDIEDGGIRQEVISQVWLLAPGDGSGSDQEERIVFDENLQHDDGKLRSEAVLRLTLPPTGGSAQGLDEGAVWARLGRILLQDHDPLVRVRAAIALGALRDERAVRDLETALLDEHDSVRTQVIGALGQIGGDRAIITLGSILLDDNVKTIERVLAAHALWKQDSEIAAGYLSSGAENSNVQVRLASSKAPSVPATGLTNQQLGPQETE